MMNYRSLKGRALYFTTFVVSISLAHAQSSPPSERENLEPASVEGRVVNALTGTPLSRAHVKLQDHSGSSSISYGAITTADGRFSINSVVPRAYAASAKRAGYLTIRQFDGAPTVILKPGARVNDLVLRLLPTGSITGHVSVNNGALRDNIIVQAIRGSVFGSVHPDEKGAFRIGGLAPGRYFVQALVPGSGTTPEIRTDGTTEVQYGNTYYPNAMSLSAAVPVQVRPGAEMTGVDIELVSLPMVRISGSVAGAPKDGHRCIVNLAQGSALQSYLAVDSRFTIWWVPPGTYRLSAQCTDASGQALRSLSLPIDVASSNVDGIELPVIHPFEVHGRIEIEPGADNIEHESCGREHKISFGSQEADIGGDCAFTVSNMHQAPYRITLSGFPETVYVKSIWAGLKEFRGATLDLRSGPPPTALLITIGTRAGEISGVVKDDKGHAITAMVGVFYEDEFGSLLKHTAWTDQDGSYSIQGVAPGKYKLLAFNKDDWGPFSDGDALPLYEGPIRQISVGEGETLCLNLTLLATLQAAEPLERFGAED
jgi:hypothetical protein